MTYLLSLLQVLVGLAVAGGGLALGATAVDRRTRWSVSLPLVGLVAWAAWFVLVPFIRGPDSLPAIALAGLVAYALIHHSCRVVAALGLKRKEPTHG
jgi:hypothetical protein